MKPYEELTARGKIRRLRAVAWAALQSYDLQVRQMRFYHGAENTIFRVESDAGSQYLLRIYGGDDSTLVENEAEMFWLDALARDTDLRVTVPVRRRDGGLITFAGASGVPGEYPCALLEWAPGRRLANYLTPDNNRQLGRAMAVLHDHAGSLAPPAHLQPKRWDKVYYFPREPVVYHDPAYRHLFSPETIAIVDSVVARVTPVLAGLYERGPAPIWIHSDLHYWNVLIHRGQLTLLDFGDILSGFPVQDIAITFYYTRHHEYRQALTAAFRRGYEEIRPWPLGDEELLADLIAARMANFVNYVALIDPDPGEFITTRCRECGISRALIAHHERQ